MTSPTAASAASGCSDDTEESREFSHDQQALAGRILAQLAHDTEESQELFHAEQCFSDEIFAQIAHPAHGGSILHIGAGSGRLLGLLIEKAKPQQQPDPSSRPGSFVAVDPTASSEDAIRMHVLAADPSIRVSVRTAVSSGAHGDSAARALVDQDRREQTPPLSSGEARLYLGAAADSIDPALIDHLARMGPGGAGYDLIVANLKHVRPAQHAATLRQLASALAPRGHLVVERQLYTPHPHPDQHPFGVPCPGQQVRRHRCRSADQNISLPVSHWQCAPDRLWEVCGEQLREQAAAAGLRVDEILWACHGDQGYHRGGVFSDVFVEVWECAVQDIIPGADGAAHIAGMYALAAESMRISAQEGGESQLTTSWSSVSTVARLAC